jgi:hypothetical protein
MEGDTIFTAHLFSHPVLALNLVYLVLPTHSVLLRVLGRPGTAYPFPDIY